MEFWVKSKVVHGTFLSCVTPLALSNTRFQWLSSNLQHVDNSVIMTGIWGRWADMCCISYNHPSTPPCVMLYLCNILDMEEDNVLRWDDGMHVTYNNWASDQPEMAEDRWDCAYIKTGSALKTATTLLSLVFYVLD